jgi:hypothetical protein
MVEYIIEDWAGNHLFKDKVFESFEDGWDFIMQQFPDEDDLQDYYVIPKQK